MTFSYPALLAAVLATTCAFSSAQTQTNTTSYQYDPVGNLTQITDPLGHVTNLQYDALNRLQQPCNPRRRPAHLVPPSSTAMTVRIS